MSILVADCPRCSAKKITFDLHSSIVVGVQYSWQQWHEAFCVCRHCAKSTVFVLSDRGIHESKETHEKGLSAVKPSANDFVNVERYISLNDRPLGPTPEHVPEKVLATLLEGGKCLSVNCFNAAATMFRLCVDQVTRELLPVEEAAGLNHRVRRDLGLRLPWLFDNGILPNSLRELSHCIKEDGNDGAHAGTLTSADAEDLLDFTNALLERIYTEPMKLKIAQERRNARRSGATP